MNFISWHYNYGIEFYLKKYQSAMLSVIHYFSLPLLLPTLFSPWKRVIIVDQKNTFNLMAYLNTLSFNLVSRAVGAVVRIILFITGCLILLFIAVFGALGLILWVLMPMLSFNLYDAWMRSPERVATNLVSQINENPDKIWEILLNSEPGKFLLNHLGVNPEDLVNASDLSNYQLPEQVFCFTDIVNSFIKAEVWHEAFMVEHRLEDTDFVEVAVWWDKVQNEKSIIHLVPLPTSGIGRELLFGYTPSIDKYGNDVLSSKSAEKTLIGRKGIVKRMERILSGGSNIILTGEPGVGKRTVLYEFARRGLKGELGAEISHRRIVEVDLNFLGSEATDINQKKSNLAQILAEASYAGNIILVIRDLHRYTNSNVEGFDFTDVFERYLEKGGLKMIAISTVIDYERFLTQNSKLRKYFDTVLVEEPSVHEAMDIILEAAEIRENKSNITVTVPALRKIVTESDQYVTDTPFPEKAIEALDAVITYSLQADISVVTMDVVDKVMSERTGIPLTKLTEDQTHKLSNLEDIIHERLVDQKEAVSLIAKILRAKSVGVVNTSRPIGSFLFLGPTGVGKTETAKVLAKVYFGTEKQIIRFDMAEYVGAEGLQRLIGSVSKDQPGVLTTAIKNKPASLLLLDEIEKAPPEIYNLFLAMLDEGKITDAFGKVVSCRNLFIVATSNAGAEYIRDIVGSGNLDDLHRKVTDHIMRNNQFSPEFLNRFDGVVVYKPLDREHLIQISKLLLNDLAKNLRSKNIFIQFSQEAIEKLAEDGYEPEFGARPMRRLIDIELGDLLGRAVLAHEVESGDRIRILPGEGKGNFKFEKI